MCHAGDIIPGKHSKSNIVKFTRTLQIFDQVRRKKQPSRGVLKKKCSQNMQQIYRRIPMPKHDFNKVAMQLY